MAYEILIDRPAQKGIQKLDATIRRRIGQVIVDLANDPRPSSSKPLVHRPAWRVRVGDYRVIYEIDDAARQVTIVYVGHRREVYRRRS